MDIGISWEQAWVQLVQLLIAWVLTLPVAWDRELDSRSAGLRTFPLVAVAACGYTLVGISVLDTTDAEARVLQGLITGIGFIGGGAILKSKGSVMGTATAASIWNTGLIGMAVAFGRYEIAAVASLINFVTLRYVAYLKTDDTPPEESA
jgi:putative Mg2+ transporter-C (MgtC) family protein